MNAPSKVSPGTRNRVLEAVRSLNYVVHSEARARTRKNFGRIGVLTPFFTAQSFVQRIRGIASAISATRHELVVYTVESIAQRDHYLELITRTQDLDGLIILSLPILDDTAERLSGIELPVVCVEHVNRYLPGVEIDNVAGGSIAAEYLYSKGRRRIAYLGETGEPAYSLHPGEQRLAGFVEAVERTGATVPTEYLMLQPFSPDGVRAATLKLLSLSNRPDAIFASSDVQAIHAVRTVREAGLRVPEDVAVMGFDNVDFAAYLDLTTIDQRLEESGRVAVELLTMDQENLRRAVRTVQLQLSIVHRLSA